MCAAIFLRAAWSNQPIDVNSGTMVDTFLQIYGPNDMTTLIAKNDEFYQRLSFIDLKGEERRTYYIRVTSSPKSTTHKTGDYSIRVIGPGGIKVMIASMSVIPLEVNTEPLVGHLHNAKEEHWYAFQPAVTGNYTVILNAPEGRMFPMKWKKFPVNYTIDRGPLGPMDSEKAIEFAKKNIETWNNISSSSFRLKYGGTLDMDVQYSLFVTFPDIIEPAPLLYDLNAGEILLFDGNPSPALSAIYFWRWNSLAWQQDTLQSTSEKIVAPDNMASSAIAFDNQLRQNLLFGGESGNETWIWSDWQWNRQSPVLSPAPRSGHAIAFDAMRQQIVLFGGISPAGDFLNDTWIWNGNSWSPVAQEQGPSPRSGHILFYDQNRKTVALFGGRSASELYNDQWEWNGSAWMRVPANESPIPQYGALAAVNQKEKQTYLVGGFTSPNANERLAETWIWNGNNWIKAAEADPALNSHKFLGMAYHARHNQLMLVGGAPSSATPCETYVWNGSQWYAWGQGITAYSHFRDELQARGINPLFFDNDGKLTDLIQGKSAGDTVRGFGKPVYLDRESGEIIGGHMFINGKLVAQDMAEKGYTGNGDDYKLGNLAQLIVHEFGHFCGLYHSQYYGYMHANSYLPDETYLPVMWGIRPRPESSVTVNGLKYDEIASLADLYPVADDSFTKSTGTIVGRAVFTDGSPVLGGIIVARSVADPYGTIVTVDTDPLVTFGGNFILPPLPPGDYEIWIEPMIYSVDGPWFHQTGFYGLYPQDRAFTRPPYPQYYQSHGSKPYGPSVAQTVRVSAQQETSIEFVCDLLNPGDPVDAKLRASQFMSFNSYMISGHGDLKPDNRLTYMPFSFAVSDGIDDVKLTVIPQNGQPLGIDLDLGVDTFFRSENSSALLVPGGNGSFSVTFNRTGDNGFSLKNGVYFVDVTRLSDDAGAYTLRLDSTSIENIMKVENWNNH